MQGTGTKKCPQCSGMLTPVTPDPNSLARCRVCGGTWVEQGQLGAILKNHKGKYNPDAHMRMVGKRGQPIAPEEKIKSFACPECGVQLKA